MRRVDKKKKILLEISPEKKKYLHFTFFYLLLLELVFYLSRPTSLTDGIVSCTLVLSTHDELDGAMGDELTWANPWL